MARPRGTRGDAFLAGTLDALVAIGLQGLAALVTVYRANPVGPVDVERMERGRPGIVEYVYRLEEYGLVKVNGTWCRLTEKGRRPAEALLALGE